MSRKLLSHLEPSFQISFKPKYTNEDIKKVSITAMTKSKAKISFCMSDEYLNCKEIINIERE